MQKINSKNAFGLHLIDYMQDLIKNVKEGEMTNFQIASCTLDAGAKIYAGRVDSIHTQAYKMLSGLGRTENDQGKNPQGKKPLLKNSRPFVQRRRHRFADFSHRVAKHPITPETQANNLFVS